MKARRKKGMDKGVEGRLSRQKRLMNRCMLGCMKGIRGCSRINPASDRHFLPGCLCCQVRLVCEQCVRHCYSDEPLLFIFYDAKFSQLDTWTITAAEQHIEEPVPRMTGHELLLFDLSAHLYHQIYRLQATGLQSRSADCILMRFHSCINKPLFFSNRRCPR